MDLINDDQPLPVSDRGDPAHVFPPPRGAFVPGRSRRESSGAPTAAEEAAGFIRRLLFDGRLRGGERVPQDDIAVALGLSRMPVREALISLQRDGWVRLERNRGFFVNPITEDAIRDQAEITGLLYGLALERAAAKMGDDERRALVETLARFVSERSTAAALKILLEFTDRIVDIAASPRIDLALRNASFLFPGNTFDLRGALANAQTEYAIVAEALEERDQAKATSAIRRLMSAQGEAVISYLRSRGVV